MIPESVIKKALPEDNRFVGGVIPRLCIANLYLSKALYVRCTDYLTNRAFLVCVLPGLVVYSNSEGESWLLYIRMRQNIGSWFQMTVMSEGLPLCVTIKADKCILLSECLVTCCQPTRKRRTW